MRTGPWGGIGVSYRCDHRLGRSPRTRPAPRSLARLDLERDAAVAKEHRMATARKPTLRGRRLVRSLWRIIRIYWTSPDAKWGGLLLAGAVALEFGTVQATVFVSDAQRR